MNQRTGEQISKMGKGKKVTKKSSALPTAARRGAGVDGPAGEFAVERMGLQGLPEAVGGGSSEESNAMGAQDQPVGPAVPQPHGGELPEGDPGSQGEGEGGVTAAARLTSEQQGQAVHERFTEDAKQKRLARSALEKAADAGQHPAGNGGQFWDSPAGYFTVGVPMLMTDRKEVVHNLCVQMDWYMYTLESLEEPQRMGLLSGD